MATKDPRTNNESVNNATQKPSALTPEQLEDAVLSALGDFRNIPSAARVQHGQAWK